MAATGTVHVTVDDKELLETLKYYIHSAALLGAVHARKFPHKTVEEIADAVLDTRPESVRG